MDTTTRSDHLHWPLIIGLGALALIRPLFSIVGLTDVLGQPATSLTLTALITLAWVGAVGFSRVRRPVATLVAAALVYAVLAALLSTILSPVLDGELQGPLTNPFGIVALMITNAVWGLVAGVLALAVQRARGIHHPAIHDRASHDLSEGGPPHPRA